MISSDPIILFQLDELLHYINHLHSEIESLKDRLEYVKEATDIVEQHTLQIIRDIKNENN